MNKLITTFAFAAFITCTFFSGCQSSDQKVESAQGKLQDAAENLDNIVKKNKEAENKAAQAEEWKLFKAESEVRIKNNDLRIAELKAKMKTKKKMHDAFYANRIDELEQQNKHMTMRIDVYEKNHSDWEAFKQEFNHDMDGLGDALKNFTTSGKK